MSLCSFGCGRPAELQNPATGQKYCRSCAAIVTGQSEQPEQSSHHSRSHKKKKNVIPRELRDPTRVPVLQSWPTDQMDEDELLWRETLKEEDALDVIDERGDCYIANVQVCTQKAVFIRYQEWSSKYSMWHHRTSHKLLRPFTRSRSKAETVLARKRANASGGHGRRIPNPPNIQPFDTSDMPEEELAWRQGLKVGDMLDSLDTDQKWFIAEVFAAQGPFIYIHYSEWSHKYDVWKHHTDPSIKMPFTVSKPKGQKANQPPPVDIPDYSTVDTKLDPKTVVSKQKDPPLVNKGEVGLESKRVGRIHRRGMPPDNSCLFHSIGYVCDGKHNVQDKTLTRKKAMIQRKRIMEVIEANPETYPDVVLGMKRDEYLTYLSDMNKWGGYIELTIFSQLFEVEIFSFDIQGPGLYRVGEGMGYTKRVFIMYYGKHYDALVYTEDGKKHSQEFFSTEDAMALLMAKEYVETLHMAQPKNAQKGPTIKWAGAGIKEVKELAAHGLKHAHEVEQVRQPSSDGESKTSQDDESKEGDVKQEEKAADAAPDQPPTEELRREQSRMSSTTNMDGNVNLDDFKHVQESTVKVSVVSGRSLGVFDSDGYSDPYCKIGLLDEKTDKVRKGFFKTDTISDSLAPDWGLNEFQFSPIVDGKHGTLLVECWDKDTFTDEFMGHVKFSLLSEIPPYQRVVQWRQLKDRKGGNERRIRGKLLVQVYWEPTLADLASLKQAETWNCVCSMVHTDGKPVCDVCGTSKLKALESISEEAPPPAFDASNTV